MPFAGTRFLERAGSESKTPRMEVRTGCRVRAALPPATTHALKCSTSAFGGLTRLALVRRPCASGSLVRPPVCYQSPPQARARAATVVILEQWHKSYLMRWRGSGLASSSLALVGALGVLRVQHPAAGVSHHAPHARESTSEVKLL